MAKVNASIDIDAPPERVWQILMDPGRLADWVTIHRKLRDVSDSPLTEGATLRQTLCVRGAKFNVDWTVADLEDQKLALWEGKGPARSKATTRYELSARDGKGTRFDYFTEFKAPLGPLGAAASTVLVGGVSDREAGRSLRRLKALAERG